jgi:hypothetical protein
MASLYTQLNKASDMACELDLITQRIDILSDMANAILEKGTNSVEVIIETHPTNGAIPFVRPIFEAHEMTLESPQEPEQVGFSRYYQLKDLGNERLLTVAVPLETPIAMALIDRTINRLKHRRDILVKRSRSILKAD